MLHGSCLCQGVAFEIDGGVTDLLYCHCSMCRKAHGTAFRARGRVQASQFRWTRGEALVRWFDSSPGQHRGFCSVCGSNLVTRFDDRPQVLGLALGVLDDDPGTRPLCHVYVGSKAPWHEITDALPQHDELPPPAAAPVQAAPEPVTLREIHAATVRDVTRLAVRGDQKHLVAPNAVSLAEALFAPEAWYRAIHCGDALAGFVMLYDETLRPEPPPDPQVAVWRFMVDARFQGRGVGRAALQQVIDHVRARGAFRKLELSYVPDPAGPEPFYRKLGFRPNGKVDEGEVVMELRLR